METGGRLPGPDGLYPHSLLTVLPVLDSGWVLLGELGKFASVSEYRFTQVAADGDVLRLTVVGEPGERVAGGGERREKKERRERERARV